MSTTTEQNKAVIRRFFDACSADQVVEDLGDRRRHQLFPLVWRDDAIA
jgi:hypothetical protein